MSRFKSTMVNDFWTPPWCTATQAGPQLHPAKLEVFRPMTKVPSTLKKNSPWNPTSISPLQPDAISYQHLTFVTALPKPLCTGATSIISSASSNFRITGFRVTGFMGWGPFPALRRGMKGRGMVSAAIGGCGAVYAACPSSFDFLYVAPNMTLKKTDVVQTKGDSKETQTPTEGHAIF